MAKYVFRLEPKDIHQLQKIRKIIRKDRSLNVLVSHSIIPLFQPITRTYREWNPKKPSQWVIHVMYNGIEKQRYYITALYEEIESIASYLAN